MLMNLFSRSSCPKRSRIWGRRETFAGASKLLWNKKEKNTTDMFMRSALLIAVQMAAMTRNGSILLVLCFLTEWSAIL